MQNGRFPHSLVLIFAMIVLAQVAAYLLPSGRYEQEPVPGEGEAYAGTEAAPPLGDRLRAARQARELSPAEVGALFGVSAGTVEGWEIGPPGEGDEWTGGTHVRAEVGPLVEAWIDDGAVPSAAQVAAWQEAAGGKQRVVPGTYHEVPKPHATDSAWRSAAEGAAGVLLAVPKGLAKAGDIIFFVFIVGGVIGVLRATGAIDALLGRAIHLLGHRPALLVGGMVTLLALGSSTIGMSEEYMPFIPILVTMCIALRLDAVVAMGIIYVGAGIGYGAAAVNPFTVLIAQDIAGLEPTSGAWFRVLFMLACLVAGVWHIMRYARRVHADPTRSLVSDVDYADGYEMPDDLWLTRGRAAVLAVAAGGIALFVWGVATRRWHFAELNAVFLGIALLAMVFGRVSPNGAARSFCTGAAEMTTTALLIGFARTIGVVLTDGEVIHTVIHGVAGQLEGAGSSVAASGMLLVQSACNFLIPSGSGQAYVTMPIMAPLADVTGVSRQTAVLAYQMGDGFTNMVVPTNALLMGMLALARIPYQRWLRFIAPLMLQLFGLSVLALVIASSISL